MENMKEKALALHREHQGKVGVHSKVPLESLDDLTLAYSPGVAEPCKVIAEHKEEAFIYTNRANSVAVVSDGSAVLGLGNIGPEAALPVMEGKAVLFKGFAGIDAVPVVLNTQDSDRIVEIVHAISPTYGGINLEDIAAPRCFEIERRLRSMCDIPIFHDDQHGTAVVALACLLNCAKLLHRSLEDFSVVINGAGAAAVAIADLWLEAGVKDIVLLDSKGILHPERSDMHAEKRRLAEKTNQKGLKGGLAEAVIGRNVFVGVSQGGVLTEEMVKTMEKDSVVMALANPTPEIMPEKALGAGAKIVCTGRSDFANQVNNVLAFPGIFRGALDVRAKTITEGMKLAAAEAIAKLSEDKLDFDYVVPQSTDRRVGPAVAQAVAAQAIKEGVAQSSRYTPEEIAARCAMLTKDSSY